MHMIQIFFLPVHITQKSPTSKTPSSIHLLRVFSIIHDSSYRLNYEKSRTVCLCF